jgi:hypothetical protein
MTKATMETLLSYILTIPLYTLFTILKRAIDNIFVNEEDQETFFNSVADSLVERNYTTEKAISAVFNSLNIYRNAPFYGACGFRCDGRCNTCLASGGGGAGVSWNESGYFD